MFTSGIFPPRWDRRSLRWRLGAAAVYAVGSIVVVRFLTQGYGLRPAHPSAGIGLSVVLLGGYGAALSVMLGAAVGGVALGWPLVSVVVVTAGATVGAAMGALVLRSLTRAPIRLDDSRGVAALVLAAGVAGLSSGTLRAIAASMGSPELVEWLNGSWPPLTVWWSTVAATTLGILVVVPAVVAWATPSSPTWDREGSRRRLEVALGTAAAIGISAMLTAGAARSPMALAAALGSFPLVAWAAGRFGARGASSVVVVLAADSLLSPSSVTSTVPSAEALTDLALIQCFVGSIAMTGMLLAAAFERRRRVERELVVSEQRMRALVDHAPEAVLLIELEPYRMVWANPQAERLFGWTVAELLGQSPGILSMPTQHGGRMRDVVIAEMIAMSLAGRSAAFEWACRHRDGTVIPVEVRLVPLPDGERRILRVSITDITQRKEEEARVGESLGLARRVTSAVPGVVYRWESSPGRAPRFTFLNGGDRRNFVIHDDQPGPEVVGPWAAVHPDDRARVDATGLAAVRGSLPWTDEFRAIRPDGEVIWVRGRGAPEPRHADGTLVYNGFFMDITAERAGADADESQRLVLEAIATGAPYAEVLDRIVHLSERLVPRASGSIMLVSEDRLQLHLAAAPSAPQVLKDALATLPIGDDGGPCGMAACTKAVIISADALGDPLLAAWGPLLREIGTAAVWSVPFFEAPGTVAGTLAVHLPTPRRPDQAELDALTTMASLAGIATQRRAADRRLRATEQQLLQAQKMEAVGQLAGGIAHDFNNLLTVILATSQLLLDDATQASVSAEATEDLRLIRESAERAGVLTRQLLTFSRRQPWQPRSVDVFQVFARLRPMFERVVGARITVDLGVDAAVAPVWIDEAQLDQVLVNLVVNARDAMPNGGLLLLEAAMVDVAAGRDAEMLGTAPGAYVRVVVRDTGTGMDDATRQRIFEPFFTTKALGEGTGLGLASCYGIVNRADGVIGVSSELGQGTTFTILLPAAGARRLVPAAIAG